MIRIGAVIVAGVLVVAALGFPAPRSLDPIPGAPDEVESDGSSSARFVHCPWALADGRRESVYAIGSVGATPFDLSFVGGGELERALSGEVAPGALERVDNPRAIGTSAVLVEFTSGRGWVGVVATGEDLLAGDLCTGVLEDTWHLPGGSTMEGERLTLRLFNPFTADARVDLWAFSELGTEAGEGLEGLTVPARRTRIVALDEILPGRESLSVIVRPAAGSVIPVMTLDTGSDVAVWPGAGQSQGWEFPVAAVDGLATEIVLTNEAALEVNFVVEIFGETGGPAATARGVIEGPGQARVPLGDRTGAAYGVRVTGDGPFGAAVAGRSETAAAVTGGSPVTSAGWLAPGPPGVPGGARLHLLNAGVVDLDVTYTPLTPAGRETPRSATIPAGAVKTVAVVGAGVSGVLVTAGSPLSVAWQAQADGRAIFAGAVPLD